MGLTALHTIYAVQNDGTLIAQVSDMRVSNQVAKLIESADGQAFPTFVAAGKIAPSIRFETTAIAAALSEIGVTGHAITGDTNVFNAFLQKFAEGGTRDSGSVHEKLTVNKGLVVPRTLTANQDSAATIQYEVFASYDGTNAPIVASSSQSLPGTPAVAEVFVAGPVVINGVQVEGVQSIEIDFGVTLNQTDRGDGDVYPTFLAIRQVMPRITIRTAKVTTLSDYGVDGAAQGATDSVIYLRKVAEGGTRVADATTEHVSFSIAEGRIEVEEVGGAHEGESGSVIVITPSYDLTTAIVAVNTATAIALP